jgi:3-oxoacyl-[acyl-carrier protein] reductase
VYPVADYGLSGVAENAAQTTSAPSELSGVALVTGGGRGVGAAIARDLAAAGMNVAVGARSDNEVREVAREIHGLPLNLDVRSEESVEAAVARTESELGPIDLLVANAGIGPPHTTEPFGDLHDWWNVFEVNVLGVFLCDRAVTPSMVERGGGRIINITSGAAYQPAAAGQSTAYGPSKAAVHKFTETLAARLAEKGIAVFSVSPGLVRTSLSRSLPDDTAWASAEYAQILVRALASGEFDSLAGRFLHAVRDTPDSLRLRLGEILESDLNSIRLRSGAQVGP